MNSNYFNHAKVLLIIGILMILISPYLLTRDIGLLDFKETGQIGDTIGGITAPISNFIGSVLVFYALRAQIDANSIIQKQIKEQQENEINNKTLQYFLDQFKMIREDINDFSINEIRRSGGIGSFLVKNENRSSNVIVHKGAAAINYLLSTYKDMASTYHEKIVDGSPTFSEVKSLLSSVDNLLSQVANSMISAEDKSYYFNLISYLFNSKLKAPFKYHEQYKLSLSIGKSENPKGLPDSLFDIVNSIQNKLELSFI